MKNWVGYKGRLKSLLLALDEIIYKQYEINIKDIDNVIRSNKHFTDQLKNKETIVEVLIDFKDKNGLFMSQWFDIDKYLLRKYKTFTAGMIDVLFTEETNTITEKRIGEQTLYGI